MTKTYKIGDVAELLNLKTYVLRFWESEFRQLRPHRTPKGQRIYTEKDVDMLRRIQKLLHEQGMTIDGARKKLTEKTPDTPTADRSPLNVGRGEAQFQALQFSLLETTRNALLRDILVQLLEMRDILVRGT